MPVPTVIYTKRGCPRPAPKMASPTAAARTSDSTKAGAISDNRCCTGQSRQSIVQLLLTLPSQSTSSATPAPMPATSICLPRAQSCSCLARSWVSFRTASPPRVGLVGIIVRWRISPEGHNTTPAAIFVPPMSNPMAPSCCLLFICGPCVIVKVMTVLPFLQPKIEWTKA